MTTRVNKARRAFRDKDVQASRKVHSKDYIERAFHQEKHNKSFSLSDIILGGQDGLVNILGVVLGVAAASQDSRIVMAGGLAGALAESISMAAVAYTSTLSEVDYYKSEVEREKWKIENTPQGEEEEIRQIYKNRGFSGQLLEDVVKTIIKDKKVWLETMLSEEVSASPIDKSSALKAALVVGLSAVVGSFVPLLPFFFFPLRLSIWFSLFLTSLVLYIVGYYKAKVTVGSPGKSGLEITLIGIGSALVGYLIGSFFKV